MKRMLWRFLLLVATGLAAGTADEFADIKLQLNAEPVLRSRVVFEDGIPKFRIGERNEPSLLYMCAYPWKFADPAFLRQLDGFRRAGIHLYGLGLTTCEKITDAKGRQREAWDGDFIALNLIEQRIYRALKLDPDARFMVCITLSYPNGWWLNRYPDELIRYANAKVDPKAKLGDFAFRAPSFASRIFREQAGDMLHKLVSYLEKTPAAKRIFAYRVDYGCFREWFYYGFDSDLLPDVSAPMIRAFRSHLRKQYQNDVAALRKAWHQPSVTFENAEPPSVPDRLRLGDDMLRDPVAARPVLDYLRALHREVLDTNLQFNGIIKKASGGRVPVGNYGGYFFGMHFGPEHRHFYNHELLSSEVVDFQASPYMYTQFRKFGEAGLGEGMFESAALYGKMGILEADTSTHLDRSKSRAAHRSAVNMRDSQALLARDFGQILCRRAGIWWMDFNEQFYDSPEFRELFHRFAEIGKLPSSPSKLTREVAFVGDFESLIFMCAKRWDKLYPRTVSELQKELSHAGAPFECIAFSDLKRPECDRFRVYIFPNLFFITPEKQILVERLKKMGKTVLFSYAPGYLTGNGRSLASFNRMTGMNAQTFPGVHRNGKIIRTANHVYYSTDGCWPRAELRRIFRTAGVHVYTGENEPVLFAGGNFLVLHTAKGGPQTLNLPRTMTVKCCFPEEKPSYDTGMISFDAPPRSTTIFYVR